MYAVIRAGGKQYRVAPGDVIKIEKTDAPAGGSVELSDILAVGNGEGAIGLPEQVSVTAQVLGDGRADKILVFHYKRKKQYKKLQGHRQPFTQLRITEINVNGERYTAGGVTAAAPAAKPKKARKTTKKAEAEQ